MCFIVWGCLFCSGPVSISCQWIVLWEPGRAIMHPAMGISRSPDIQLSAFCEQKLIEASPLLPPSPEMRTHWATKIWMTVDSIFDHSQGRVYGSVRRTDTEQWKSRDKTVIDLSDWNHKDLIRFMITQTLCSYHHWSPSQLVMVHKMFLHI